MACNHHVSDTKSLTILKVTEGTVMEDIDAERRVRDRATRLWAAGFKHILGVKMSGKEKLVKCLC